MSDDASGTVEEPTTGQRFWFSGGIFYAAMSAERPRRADRPAVFGEWKMSGLVDAVPDTAVGVWFGGPAGDGGPSDVEGLSWHEACVKARLEGAHARTERENERRNVARLERLQAAQSSAVQEEQAIRHRTVLALETAVRRLEVAYGGDGSRTERAVWQDAGDDPDWPREHWTTWPTDQALDQIVALIGALADADHPSVSWPSAGAETRAWADGVFRARVAEGDSLADALGEVLDSAAMRVRRGASTPSAADADRQE